MKPSFDNPGIEDSDISSVAYRLWQEAGRPSGRFMDFWMKAMRLVTDEQKAVEKSRTPKPVEAPASGIHI